MMNKVNGAYTSDPSSSPSPPSPLFQLTDAFYA